MKLTKNQNHGLEGLNDYTDFSSVKSNNPCHQENSKNQGSDNMKQGWEIKKLGEVSEILNGGTPKTNVAEFWDGDINWITPADLGKLRKPTVNDTPRKITRVGLEKSSAKLFPENSIILSTRAPIGHLAINEVPMSTNQGCRGIVPSKKLDTWYLYYFLKKNVELLDSLGTGATFKELSTKALSGVEIPLPPLPEQQRIVSILDECFAAIDKAKANAEQNLKNAKELFESYLQGVFERKSLNRDSSDLLDDPDSKNQKKSSNQANQKNQGSDYLQGVFERKSLNRDSSDLLDDPDSKNQKKSSNQANQKNQGSDYLQGVFEKKGDGWEERCLGEIGTFRNGMNFTKSSKGEEIKIVGVKDFQDNFWVPFDELESVVLDGNLNEIDELKENDIIAVRSNGNPALIGRTLLAGEVEGKISHSGFTIRISLNSTDKVLPIYLCRYLKTQKTRKELVEKGNGVGIKSLNQGSLSSLVIPYPKSLKEQQTIVRQLDALRAETQKLEAVYQKKIADLEELKKSILQKAFAGELETEKAVVI